MGWRRSGNTSKGEVSEVKREATKRLIFNSILMLDALVIMTMASVAWFAKNTETSSGGMLVNVSSPNGYELASKGSLGQYSQGEYASTLALQRKTGDLRRLSAETEVYATSAEKPSIEWMLRPDSHMQNEYLTGVTDENYPKLQPGTNGAISFYILPPESAVGTADLDITLRLIPYTHSEGEAPYEMINAETPVAELLKGHILFFREYSGGMYSGWIYNEAFSVQVEGNAPKEVTLYWVWPLYYSNLSGEINSICEDSEEQAQLLEDMNDYPQKYFFFTDSSDMENFSLEGESNAYHSANYNRADEQIGINIPYVLAEISIY